MSHCPPEALKDLKDLLGELKTWPHLIEKSTGVFYFKLHFHYKDGERWADIKFGKQWNRVTVPLSPKKSALNIFQKELKKSYASFMKAHS